MPLIFAIFLTLIILCLVFGLAYGIILLIKKILPVPMKEPVTTIMLILLSLMAICCLLDLVGLFGVRHLLLVH